jgi:hypothetical protein
MTLITLKRPMVWPNSIGYSNTASTNPSSWSTLDAAGEYVSLVFQAKEAMTISHVGFRCNAVSGSPTADVRIETVDTATGLPTGTLWATDTNIVTATLTTSWALHALTASASISAGQIYCVKVAYNSGTSFALSIHNAPNGGVLAFPYAVVNTGTPTKAGIGNIVAMALGSSSTSFYNMSDCGIQPISAGNAGGTFNNTNGARRGLRFTIPFNARCVGLRFFRSNSAGDFNAILMSDAGSELSSSSTAFDGDVNGNQTFMFATDCYFDNPVTLTAGTTYRAVIEPSTATSTNLFAYTIPSADYANASPCGTFAHYTTYASAAWNDTATTTYPYLDILIDQIDDGAGSGSGARQKVYGG